MLKCNEVIGLPVIDSKQGVKMGAVKDVLFDIKTRKLKGILIEQNGYELKKKVIEKDNILSLGRDAIVVTEHSCIKKMSNGEFKKRFGKKNSVRGYKIFSDSGDELGAVRDILFDFEYGIMEGVEITDGIMQDIIEGRNVIPLIGNVEFGKDQMIVGKQSLEEMISSGKGLKKLFGGSEQRQ